MKFSILKQKFWMVFHSTSAVLIFLFCVLFPNIFNYTIDSIDFDYGVFGVAVIFYVGMNSLFVCMGVISVFVGPFITHWFGYGRIISKTFLYDCVFYEYLLSRDDRTHSQKMQEFEDYNSFWECLRKNEGALEKEFNKINKQKEMKNYSKIKQDFFSKFDSEIEKNNPELILFIPMLLVGIYLWGFLASTFLNENPHWVLDGAFESPNAEDALFFWLLILGYVFTIIRWYYLYIKHVKIIKEKYIVRYKLNPN